MNEPLEQELIESTASALTVENVVTHFLSLNETGMDREQLYRLSMAIVQSPQNMVSEEVEEEIGEFVSVLVGHCARSCILRLRSDPPCMTDDQFVQYVRNVDWSSDAEVRPSC